MFKLGNIASMMGGLQKLPQAISDLTERLRQEQFDVTSGDGAVRAVFNGLGDMQSIEFVRAEAADEDLQQWTQEVVNEGHREAKRRYAEAMQALAEELNLEGLPGLDSALASLNSGQ